MATTNIALVTGASSGFGKLTARELLRQGYRVFGTSRSERVDEAGVEMLVLDVCCDESVRSCVERVLEAAGRIDLVVNNAGTIRVGLAEESALENAMTLFETNFFGVVRMINAVLPSMRQRRQGRIINVGSLAGLVAVPGEAHYSASKFALEGYSEALRYEVEQFGIKVSLIEPGFFNTGNHVAASKPAYRIADYDGLRTAIERSIEESTDGGGAPQEVAKLIVRIAQDNAPRLRYRVGTDARWVPRLKRLLPEPLFSMGLRSRFKLKEDNPCL